MSCLHQFVLFGDYLFAIKQTVICYCTRQVCEVGLSTCYTNACRHACVEKKLNKDVVGELMVQRL